MIFMTRPLVGRASIHINAFSTSKPDPLFLIRPDTLGSNRNGDPIFSNNGF